MGLMGYWALIKFYRFLSRSVKLSSQSVEQGNFLVLLSVACTFLILDLYQFEQLSQWELGRCSTSTCPLLYRWLGFSERLFGQLSPSLD